MSDGQRDISLINRCVSIFENHTFWCIVSYPILFYLAWVVIKKSVEWLFHVTIQIEINSNVASSVLQDSLNLLMFSIGSLTLLFSILNLGAQHDEGKNLKSGEKHKSLDEDKRMKEEITQETKQTVWERINNKVRELAEKPWYGELYRQYLYFAGFSFISYVLAWILKNTNVDGIILCFMLYAYAVALGFFAVILIVWGFIILGISHEIDNANNNSSDEEQEDEDTNAEFDHGL